MSETALDLQRILQPVDLGPSAWTAWHEAVFLAHRYGAELTLMSVVPGEEPGASPRRRAGAELPGARQRVEELLSELEDAARARLAELAGGAGGAARVRTQVERAEDAAPAILQVARRRREDFIVMATRGRRGLRRLFLGSVAEDVVRHAPCPVLTVRDSNGEDEEPRPSWPNGIRRVVVPVDLSPRADLSLGYARKLAADVAARLEILHVVGSVMQATRTGIRGRLRSRMRQVEGPDVDYRIHVEGGFAATRVSEFAGERQADLIVLSSHGRSGPARVVFGSVAERIIRRAPCPVLTVKVAAPLELAAEATD